MVGAVQCSAAEWWVKACNEARLEKARLLQLEFLFDMDSNQCGVQQLSAFDAQAMG